VEKDEENGKDKAVGVTGIGGGPCAPPPKKGPMPVWHEDLLESVRESLTAKEVTNFSSGTVDVSTGPARIKLGNGGYISMASKDAVVCEGSYTYSEQGEITPSWEKAMQWKDQAWALLDSMRNLPGPFNLEDGKKFATCLLVGTLQRENPFFHSMINGLTYPIHNHRENPVGMKGRNAREALGKRSSRRKRCSSRLRIQDEKSNSDRTPTPTQARVGREVNSASLIFL